MPDRLGWGAARLARDGVLSGSRRRGARGLTDRRGGQLRHCLTHAPMTGAATPRARAIAPQEAQPCIR